MTTAEHVKIVNDFSLSQRPTLPAARGKARPASSSANRDLFLVCLLRILYCIKVRPPPTGGGSTCCAGARASRACVAPWGVWTVCVHLMVLVLCMWRSQWVGCRTLPTALLRVAGEVLSTCVAIHTSGGG